LPENYTEVISGLGKRKASLAIATGTNGLQRCKTVALTELAFFEQIQ
jgi:hypothetical protein